MNYVLVRVSEPSGLRHRAFCLDELPITKLSDHVQACDQH